jgi:hypothetical protein
MSSLVEYQQWMKSQIRPSSAGSPLPGAPLASPAERMAVYAGGYCARLRESLAEVYEAVRFVLGERAFAALSDDYAAQHPSHEYNLSFAGRALPEFLSRAAITASLPFLPDLARLERSVCEAFHAFEAPPLKPETLAPLSSEEWARLRLEFQPAVHVVSSAWPILDIWSARRGPRDQVNMEVVGRAQHVLVFRRGLDVRCEALEDVEQRTLSALIDGRTMGEACAALEQTRSTRIQRWFATWIREGIITRVDLRSSDAYGTLRRD